MRSDGKKAETMRMEALYATIAKMMGTGVSPYEHTCDRCSETGTAAGV